MDQIKRDLAWFAYFDSLIGVDFSAESWVIYFFTKNSAVKHNYLTNKLK